MSRSGTAAQPTRPLRLLVATTNRGKLREIRSILQGLSIDLATLADLAKIEPPEETGATFEANAREKALYYARVTGLPAVAEDSGLEIDALEGRPGVHSARFGGAETGYPEKFALIYDEFARRGVSSSAARFVCAVAFAVGDRIQLEARGTIEGRIAPAPRGTNGFGYDPIFFYPPYGRTLAEASQAEKAAVSHRGQAFREFRRKIEALTAA